MLEKAKSSEKWIIFCLFYSGFNKKMAASVAGVHIRRVQEVEKMHREEIERIKNAERVRASSCITGSKNYSVNSPFALFQHR